ncbi:hypothetical protein VF14_23990 [Nostoc linckia z18]|uniref:Circularly permuted type 2 ATP-grasp protein n=2 Tax=Nostoc linckia TaxID=92942 RepID=A0A9Q5Z9C2_NOSLI|nr:hypothetical protein [Nostoc linckia]PHK39978.1 hypothetical protein VF12_12260 [Nostoc linckia z15]PHK43998.1 hypothetical protein VF13_24105 [Nostoc linckia z16]PHJ56854.1 hypothetical protein VF02_31705 [Nostoc linckia z1]PHJ58744.1 hypothetical protein VF05_33295 [Nostoc linckia z3]PHJ62552.1 hypothetical protein VF03_31195 [Nostoc linckia z2]
MAMFGLSFEETYQSLISEYASQAYQEIEEIEKKCEDKKNVFRNTPFALYPRVLIVDSHLRSQTIKISEKLLNILEKVIQVFEKDKETQDFFMLDEIAESLVKIDPGYKRKIRISRFDTFLTGDATPFKVLENNTDCPAGVIFTGRIMKLIRQVPTISKLLNNLTLVDEAIESSLAFVSELLSVYHEFCGTNEQMPTIAILQPHGKVSPESLTMINVFSEYGISSVVADPREFEYKGEYLLFDGKKVDLVWNKINTANFIPLLQDITSIQPFLHACSERAICHVNSFQARYITESKLCLAYLNSSNFQSNFTHEEQDLLKYVLPWSHKLEDGTAQYYGRELEIREIAFEYQSSLVLKAAYDIRGDGVVIGRSLPPDEWKERINICWGKPFILQEFIPPPKVIVPAKEGKNFTFKNFSFDLFMFGGQFQGFGSKISDNEKLNLFQGGSKQPVFSLT